MADKNHWEHIYETKGPRDVSWYQEHAVLSHKIIKGTGVDRTAQVIDVGGGTSTLVDDLLADGYTAITVLDISHAALQRTQDRLANHAGQVRWVEADITRAVLPGDYYDVWHDRAVFHFLTDEADRAAYIEAVNRSVKKGGHVIVASFGIGGPEKCSGLDVVRYSPESMHTTFGNAFVLVNSMTETHHTPFGTDQEFVYCYCRKG